jgi:hypothetical protein
MLGPDVSDLYGRWEYNRFVPLANLRLAPEILGRSLLITVRPTRGEGELVKRYAGIRIGPHGDPSLRTSADLHKCHSL